MVKVEYPLK